MSDDLKRIFSSVIGLEAKKGQLLPNIADQHSPESIRIAQSIVEWLGSNRLGQSRAQTKGKSFEVAVAEYVEVGLSGRSRIRIHQDQTAIDQFAQYRHLDDLDSVTQNSPLLRATMTGDHRIRPDIVLSRPSKGNAYQEMVASISCKLTLRSDRAQNARSEALNLLRLRSGPAPRVCLVTAEPLPTRLESIARGTGDLDHVFHIALEPLMACNKGNSVLAGLVEARRLLPIAALRPYLALDG